MLLPTPHSRKTIEFEVFRGVQKEGFFHTPKLAPPHHGGPYGFPECPGQPVNAPHFSCKIHIGSGQWQPHKLKAERRTTQEARRLRGF